MTMEKYSVDTDTLLLDLQNEEASLMKEIGQCMSNPFGDDEGKQGRLENRFQEVRAKIEELRAKKQAESKVQDR